MHSAFGATSDVGDEKSIGTSTVDDSSSAAASTPAAAILGHGFGDVDVIKAFDAAAGFAKGSSDRIIEVAMDELKRMREARAEERGRAVVEREEAIRRACQKSNEKVESTQALLAARESLTSTLQSRLSEERARTAKLQAHISRIETQTTGVVSEERPHKTEVIANQLQEKNAALTAEIRKRTADVASMKETLKVREKQRDDFINLLASSDEARHATDKECKRREEILAREVGGLKSRPEDAVRAQREMESNHAASNEESTVQITRKVNQIAELEWNLETAKVGLESKNSTINGLQKTLENQGHHVKNLRERAESAEGGLDAARSLYKELRRAKEETEKLQRDSDKAIAVAAEKKETAAMMTRRLETEGQNVQKTIRDLQMEMKSWESQARQPPRAHQTEEIECKWRKTEAATVQLEAPRRAHGRLLMHQRRETTRSLRAATRASVPAERHHTSIRPVDASIRTSSTAAGQAAAAPANVAASTSANVADSATTITPTKCCTTTPDYSTRAAACFRATWGEWVGVRGNFFPGH